MRVSTGHNPHSYQQQRTNGKGKDKGFSDMLTGMAAQKHGKPDAAKDGSHRPHHTDTTYSPLRLVNPRIHLGTEIKLTAEQAAELDALKKAASSGSVYSHEYDNRVEPSGNECLQKYEEVDKPEFHYSQPLKPIPKYPASIYDIPADELKSELMGALKACAALDTTGLSKAEIYNQIESIYKDFLGSDFKEPVFIGVGFSDHSGGGFSERSIDLINAYHEFERRLIEHGISTEDSQTVREARGYVGMSDSEVKAAVRGQYPEVMTLKDCILMSHELRGLGFEEEGAYAYRVKDRIFSTMGLGWSPEAQKVFDAMLDMPADFDATMSKYEAFAKNDYKRYLPQNADEMFEQLMSWIGGSGLYSQEMLNQIRNLTNNINLDYDLKDMTIPGDLS